MNRGAGSVRVLIGVAVVAVVVLWGAINLTAANPKPFTVGHGVNAHQLAQQLHDAGFIWHRATFLLWARWYGTAHIHPGVYTLDHHDTGRSILKKFLHGPPLLRVTFPEGWSAQQMAAALESKGVCDAAGFMAVVNQEKHEGFLFPDTYLFPQGSLPKEVVDRLVHRFHEKEPKDMVARGKAMHLTYLQIVTLASLVEKEARSPKERPLIAGVYYNRLRKHMRLEADPTVQYALGQWKSHLHYKDLEVDSPYNTYRHFGLPPGPICNPGAASLDAAAHPTPTEDLFFVAEGDGTHRFTKTYAEHMAIQKVMRKPK